MFHRSNYVPPQGISARQSGQRLEQFMFDCSSHTANSEFVVVTHGGIITDFMMNVFTNQQLNHLCPNFKTVQSLFIPECSITVICYDEGKYGIDEFAFTTHLTESSMN